MHSLDESQVKTVNHSHISAHLIGVSHADVALVLARHVAVDGIDIIRADQLIHWNVSTHTKAHTQTLTCIHTQEHTNKKASLNEKDKNINLSSFTKIQTTLDESLDHASEE